MAITVQPQCGKCMFFARAADGTARGECRRHPPQVIHTWSGTPNPDGSVPYKYGCHWPIVLEGQGCGEFQPGAAGLLLVN